MLKEINTNKTIGELVLEFPPLANLFEELSIDYCCGGKKSLEETCQKKELSLDETKSKIEAFLSKEPNAEKALSMEDSYSTIIEHLLKVYHEPTKDLLHKVLEQSEKVARVHGEKNEKLRPLYEKVTALVNDLLPHMEKEENVLFPYLLQLDTATSAPPMHCGTVANPISVMEREHDETGVLLKEINELTDNFTPPDWACNTYRVLFDRLKTLEKETHKHIHLENCLLFPKTLQFLKDNN